MTKRQIRKEGYQLIVNSGKSHQEAFDTLKDTNAYDQKGLAEMLSGIPSGGKQREMATLRYVYMGLLGVIILLRLASFISRYLEGDLKPTEIVLLIVVVAIVPAIGIYACVYGKTDLYRSVGILLGFSFIRSFGPGTFSVEAATLVALGLLLLTIVLAFILPIKLKTPYTTTYSTEHINGTNQHITHYHFEDTRLKRVDILDDGI